MTKPSFTVEFLRNRMIAASKRAESPDATPEDMDRWQRAWDTYMQAVVAARNIREIRRILADNRRTTDEPRGLE